MKRSIGALLLVLAACGGESLSVNLSAPIVELDVFSGRPNPRWQLSAEEGADLENRLGGLPQTDPAEIPAPLGYRGFRIQDENDLNITVATNGLVVVHSNSGDKFYRDTKNVEGWLKAEAEVRGYGRVVDRAQ